jgi:hypothetical protein
MRNASKPLIPALVAALAVAGAAAAEPIPVDESPGTPRVPRGEVTAAPGPSVAFERTEIDLGKVPEGDDATATFTFENKGQEELRILRAKAG